MRAWTLRFDDHALEAEYTAAFAREHRRMIRIAIVIGLVIWVGCGAFDEISGGSAANGAWFTRVRLWLGTPLLVPPVVFAYVASEARFARRWQLVGGLYGASALVSVVVFIALIPEPELYDPLVAVWGAVIVIVGVCLLLGLRFVTAALLVTSFQIALAAITLTQHANARTAVSLFAIASATSLGCLGAYFLERSRREVFVLRRKADALLRNVLPETIAARLKDGERIAEHFDDATVLFGDLVGFTALAQELSAQEVVARLDDIFSELDDIAERHGLEKIKTIGDAYMVVGGVPMPRADHAHAVAAMAIDMLAAVSRRGLRMRIGIHSGPLVAGVIGKK